MARQLGSPASMRASATNTLEGVDEWDELADRAEATSPWLRPGWILAWWRAFGHGALEIVSVRREGRLSALVPLERTRAVLSSTANYHTPSFGILAEDEVAARQLAEELMARRARRLHLAFVSAETLSSSDLASRGRRAGYRILERTLTGALPEGARIQLAPSFNVDSLEHRWERTIARALQVYGMYLVDRVGGGVGLVAQNPQSYAHNPYGWGDKTYVYLPSSLVSYLRVLKLPAQSRHEIKILPSRCAVIR
jgi:hypothetical protein